MAQNFNLGLLGQYINVTTDSVTFTSNVVISGAIGGNSGLIANGSLGTAGQVLTSNGSNIYWGTGVGAPGSGGYQGSTGFQGSFGFQGSIGNVGFAGSAGAGGGGGGGSIFATFSGLNNQQLGTERRYFNSAVTISKMTVWVSSSSASALTVRLNKNTSPIGTVVLPAGSFIASNTMSASLTADVDYLTLDIVSGSGTDIGVRID